MDKLKQYIDGLGSNRTGNANLFENNFGELNLEESVESTSPNIILLKFARRRQSESGLGFDLLDDQVSDRRPQEGNQGEHSKSRERLRRKVAISKAIKSVDEFKLVYSRESSQARSRPRRRKEEQTPAGRLLQGDARVNRIVDG